MSFPRRVCPEILDALAGNDPRALRARKDLHRINTLIGQSFIMGRLLRACTGERPPRVVVDLGSGDGRFSLRVARRLARRWLSVKLFLIDRQALVSATTLEAFRALGWEATSVTSDVFHWLTERPREPVDLVTVNLFLHHLQVSALLTLFQELAATTRAFVACEPRRSRIALAGCAFLAPAGIGKLIRHDARVSVHAGFMGKELSALWPQDDLWQIQEWRGGVFSHCFFARQV
ncbi:MAG: methyltransferase domain-containing protein [Gammaproteobacteria bacterium]